MDFSERVRSVEPSATIRISDLANDLKSQGADVVDLSVGEPDFATPDHIREEAKDSLDRGETHYTPSKGIPSLREAIAHKFRQENELNVTRDEVIVTPGAKQALLESIFALINEGDEVVLLDPAWVSYEAMVKMSGGKIKRVNLNPETGFTPEGVDLHEVVSNDTRLMVVNTPANPTGAVFPRTELAKIKDLAVDHDFWVISDEIYEKIVYDAEHHSIGSMDGMYDRTVTVNGFSKAYAMTGWRLGYYTGPENFLNEAAKVHSHSVSSATSFVQHGGVAALDGPQDPVEEMRSEFKERRDLVMKELKEAGVEFPTPQGAFYVFVPVETEDDTELCEEMLEDKHVATTPGSAFGVEGYIRLSYATSKNRLEEGLGRIKEYL